NLNLANSTVLPLLQDGGNANEFTIQADVSGTHVVADLTGFFFSNHSTRISTNVVFNSTAVAANAAVSLQSPVCPAGFRATAGGWLAGFFGSPASIASNRPSDGSTTAITGINVQDRWLVQLTNT